MRLDACSFASIWCPLFGASCLHGSFPLFYCFSFFLFLFNFSFVFVCFVSPFQFFCVSKSAMVCTWEHQAEFDFSFVVPFFVFPSFFLFSLFVRLSEAPKGGSPIQLFLCLFVLSFYLFVQRPSQQ